MRTIITCPGIGDFIWLAMKLVNQPEQFKVVMSESLPQRGHQMKNLVPQLIAEHEYKGIIPYKDVNNKNAGIGNWSSIKADQFYLSANAHLEAGKRIEEFLPDLDTSFVLDYRTDDDDKGIARVLLPASEKYIGIYTSAYSNARNWNGWTAKEWFELIARLHPGEVTFVLIGAEYDVGVTDDLTRAMQEDGISFINTIGQPLSVVVEILRRLSYFIGFPSGLSILNETLGKDGTMFYPKHLQKMINTWAEPRRIENSNYKGCLFCDPEDLFNWLKNTYQIFDRL